MAQKLTSLLSLLNDLSTSGGSLTPEEKQTLITRLRSAAVLQPLLRYLQLNHAALTQLKQTPGSTWSFNPGIVIPDFEVDSSQPDQIEDILAFYDLIVKVGAQGTPIEDKTKIFKHDDVSGQDFLEDFEEFVGVVETENVEAEQPAEESTDDTPVAGTDEKTETESGFGVDFGKKSEDSSSGETGGGETSTDQPVDQAAVSTQPKTEETPRVNFKPQTDSFETIINQTRLEFTNLLEFQVVKAMGLHNPELGLNAVTLGPEFQQLMLSQVNREVTQLLRDGKINEFIKNGKFDVLKFRSTLWRKCLIHTAWMFDPALNPQEHPEIFALKNAANQKKAEIIKDRATQPEFADKEVPQSQNTLVTVLPSQNPDADPAISLEDAQNDHAEISDRKFEEEKRGIAANLQFTKDSVARLAAKLPPGVELSNIPNDQLIAIMNEEGLGGFWGQLNPVQQNRVFGSILAEQATKQFNPADTAELPRTRTLADTGSDQPSPAPLDDKGLDLEAFLKYEHADRAFINRLKNAGMAESDALIIEYLYKHYALTGGHPNDFLAHLKEITGGKIDRAFFVNAFGRIQDTNETNDIAGQLRSVIEHYDKLSHDSPLLPLLLSNAIDETRIADAQLTGNAAVFIDPNATPEEIRQNFEEVVILSRHYKRETVVKGLFGQNLDPEKDGEAVRFQKDTIDRLDTTQKKQLAVFYGVLYRGAEDEEQLMRMVQIVGLNPGYSFDATAQSVYQQEIKQYLVALSQNEQAWADYIQQIQEAQFIENIQNLDQLQQQQAIEEYFNTILFNQQLSAEDEQGRQFLQQRQNAVGQIRALRQKGLVKRVQMLLKLGRVAPVAGIGVGIGGFIASVANATSVVAGGFWGAMSGAITGASLGALTFTPFGILGGAVGGAILGGAGGAGLTFLKLQGAGGASESLATGASNFSNAVGATGKDVIYGIKSHAPISGSGEAFTAITGGGQTILSSASTIALTSIAGSVAFIGVGTVLSVTAILTAFLPEVDTTYIGAQQGEFSRFVSITKKASPSKTENNYDSEAKTITYTITITPKAGFTIVPTALTDKFSYIGLREPEKIPEVNGTKLSPSLDHTEETTTASDQLLNSEITDPVSFEYTVEMNGEDVLVSNTFELSFNAIKDGQTLPDTLKAVSSVTIGDPQLGCFEFGESGVPMPGVEFTTQTWPLEYQEQFTRAYLAELGQNTTHATLLCSRGPITVYYLGDNRPWGGWAPSALKGNVIGLYVNAFKTSQGTVSDSLTKYVVAHELMHILAIRNPQLETDFQANRSAYNGCFTYPVQIPGIVCSDWEAFAEAGMLYTYYQTYSSRYGGESGKYDFKGKHPKEYDWFKENVFGGVEY